MDLTPFHCKGFSEFWDDVLIHPEVSGVDADHSRGTIRVCPETMEELYHGDYSPRRIRYRRGSRPMLEMIASPWRSLPERDKALKAMNWAHENVPHRNIARDVPGTRAMTEEQLIESRVGWCNEQARVAIALCAVMEIPGRMCFLFHVNGKSGHACCELFIENKWVFHDVTYNVRVELPDGTLATAAELSGPYRKLLKPVYDPAAAWFLSQYKPYVDITFDRDDSMTKDRFFHQIGVSNYICDGVDVLEPTDASRA